MTEEDITQIDADLDSSTEQYTYDLKIPKDRVAVLIGKKG